MNGVCMKRRMKIVLCAGFAVICLLTLFLYSGTKSNNISIETIDELYFTQLKKYGFQYELLQFNDPSDHNAAVKLYGQISSPYEPAWVEIYAIQRDREEFENLIDKQIPMGAERKQVSNNNCEYAYDVFENRQPADSKITYAMKIRKETGTFGLLFTFNLIKADDLNRDQKCINSIMEFLKDARIITGENTAYDDLRPSMKMFSGIDHCYEANSDHFSVKITGIQKTEDDFSYNYAYSIAVAPLKDEPMRISRIEFSNDELLEQKFTGVSLPREDQISDYFENIRFADKNSFEAFRWVIKKSIAKSTLKYIDYSEEELDNSMKKINMKFVFNKQEELLEITCDDFISFEVPSFRGEYVFGVLGEY